MSVATETAALEAALAYAARGWRVVPIIPGKKHPGLDEWQKRATTDADLIREWWSRWPDHGVGIATGAGSGFFVLDVDVSDDKRGDDTLADLEAEFGPLPQTVEVITGTHGRHIYFRAPDDVEIRNDQAGALGPGLDIRGDGGQVLAPPTTHPNGTRYEWESESHPDDVDIAEAPEWLVELLTKAPDPSAIRRERAERVDGALPGDRFAAMVSWPDLLEADGATYLGTRRRRDGTTYECWARPGVTDHTSATLYYMGSDVLKVFTSNWGGMDPETGEVWRLDQDATYTKFGYYAARYHNGNHSDAARAILRQYGDPDMDRWLAELGASKPFVPLVEGDAVSEPPPAPRVLQWDTPQSLGAPTPAPFPVEALPAWMADYCTALADEMQVPVDLCAQVAIGAWSAVCAGKAKVAATPTWKEHLNLFLATAMHSGTGKSPVSKRLTAPVRQLEAELADMAKGAISEAKARRKAQEKEVAAAEKSGDTSRMAKAYTELELCEVPRLPRLVVDDVTQEKLAVLLSEQKGRIALISTEATMFDLACGVYSSKPPNNAVYLQGWSADPLIIDRKGATAGDGTEIRVPEPVLTVAITVQPSTIAELRKHPELHGRGFTARFMYSLPPDIVGSRNRWKVLEESNIEAAETYEATFLHHARRFAAWQTPALLKLDHNASRTFVAWMHDMEPLLGDEAGLGSVREWSSKLHSSVVRLAGLLHLADGHDHNTTVSEETLERAITVGEYWISHALAIAAVWQADPISDLAAEIVKRRFGDEGVTSFEGGDIYQKWHRKRIEAIARDRGVTGADVVFDVLTLLEERGYIQALGALPVERPSRGKPRQSFLVNPLAVDNAEITRLTRSSIQIDRSNASSSLSTSLPIPMERRVKSVSDSAPVRPPGWSLIGDPDDEGAA